MSKKCVSCGAELADDVMFCDKCGAKQDAAPAANSTTTADAKPAIPQNTIIIVAVAAAAVVVIALCVLLLGGGYKKPIKAWAKAYSNEEPEKITKTLSDDVLDAYDDYYEKSGYDDYEDYLDKSIESFKESMDDNYDLGDDFKVSIEVVDKIKLTEDELKDVKRNIKEQTGEKFDVTKGYNVAVKETYKGDEKVEQFRTFTICKVDGKWIKVY